MYFYSISFRLSVAKMNRTYATKRSGKLAEFSFNSMNMFCNKTDNIHLFIGFFSDEIFPWKLKGGGNIHRILIFIGFLPFFLIIFLRSFPLSCLLRLILQYTAFGGWTGFRSPYEFRYKVYFIVPDHNVWLCSWLIR